MLAILIIIANHKTVEQIQAIDFLAILKQLKITDELSQSRLQGIEKIIERIKLAGS